MSGLPYDLMEERPEHAPMGLIVLSTDETLELEFRGVLSDSAVPLYVSRIASAAEVSTDALAGMETRLAAAAALLPNTQTYPVIGYGCTSASAVIGSNRVEEIVSSVCDVGIVTNPLRAAIAQAEAADVSKFALLSPYVEEVNVPLREAFTKAGLSTDVFGTFAEPSEAKVARISEQSIYDAATRLGADKSVDAIFISCTNLRTFGVLKEIREALGKPVFSSNQSLCWHMQTNQKGIFP